MSLVGRPKHDRRILVPVFFSLCLLALFAFSSSNNGSPVVDDPADPVQPSFADVASLVDWYHAERDVIFPIVPPGEEPYVHFPASPVAFEWKSFPAGFTDNLLGYRKYGVPLYPVTICEDAATRETIFYNAEGDEIWSVPAAADYDPLMFYELWYAGSDPANDWPGYAEWLGQVSDPARVYVKFELIPAEHAASYQRILDFLAREKSNNGGNGGNGGNRGRKPGDGISLMRSIMADSDIIFDSATRTTNGFRLEIGYPSSFTHPLEIYSCTDRASFAWVVLATNLSTSGTNSIFWTDTNFINADIRFYVAANADEDQDGDAICDGREMYIWRTSAATNDSDGDALVDGYSGVVSTNAYPGGAHTNGGIYVEGEITWTTDALNPDTDDDGVFDGYEVSHGTDPLDPNKPPNVSGTIAYTGGQTGNIRVVAVTSSNSWSTNSSALLAAPGAYRIANLLLTNYWLRAWRDSNGNGSHELAEAHADHAGNPLTITNRLTGYNITLSDTDSDSDGMPDYWEIANGFSPTNAADAIQDFDGDGYTNLEEFQVGTDPTNIQSHPENLGGTVLYASGAQTGTIWVIATTSAASWTAAGYTNLSGTGTWTITHLLPDQNYWVKAWRDSEANGTNDYFEACGTSADNPVSLTNSVTNLVVALADPDTDGDGLPDYWELLYGYDPLNGGIAETAGWWKLDEASGTNVADSSTYANNGVTAFTNGWTAGVISNALSFDGIDDYVQVGDSESLNVPYVSLALWFKPAMTYSNAPAVFVSKKAADGSAGYELAYTNGKLAFVVGATGTKAATWSCTLTNGVWYYLMGTYGEVSQRVYVNGSLAAFTNRDWGSSYSTMQTTNLPLRIGTAAASLTNFACGTMDNVQVYACEIASNQVYALYQVGRDEDGDGFSTWQEYRQGTLPNNADNDGDGRPDLWESQHGMDPYDPNDDAGSLGSLLEEARQKIVTHWNMIYAQPPAFTNAPGSQADLTDLMNRLQDLSNKFLTPVESP